MDIDREKTKSWKDLTKGTLKIPETFQGTFNFDSVVQGSKT